MTVFRRHARAPRLNRAHALISIVAACLAMIAMEGGVALGQSNMGGHQPKDEGQRLYEKANCVGCHKWHGGGGGGYGGPALSLRDTQLEREQIIEVVRCGRPATGMPYHDRDAYRAHECYGGLTVEALGKDMPNEAANFLRPQDIEKVVDYVLQHIKGKGPPSYQDCVDFFGAGARACDVYRPKSGGDAAMVGK
jgi:mono/diheme cytochrome c family protein